MDETTLVGQKAVVMGHLREHGSITSKEAFGYGITRLSAIIYELRKEWDIETVLLETRTKYGTSRYAKYVLGGQNG